MCAVVYIVMAYIVMACAVLTYIVMAYIVMACGDLDVAAECAVEWRPHLPHWNVDGHVYGHVCGHVYGHVYGHV